MPQRAHYRRNNLIVALTILLLIGLTVLVGIRIYQLHHIDTAATSTKIVNDVLAAVGNNLPIVKRQQPPAAFDMNTPNWKDPGGKPGTLTYVISTGSGIYGPLRKLTGYDYYIQPLGTSVSFRASSVANAKLVDKIIGTESQKHGLVLQPRYKPVHRDTSVYKNAVAYCEVRTPAPYNPADTYFDFTVSCADSTAYDQAADTLRPFVLAYKTGRPDVNTNDMVYTSPSISLSKTPGYKIATVGTSGIQESGSIALFYAKNDVWHYWASTQMGAYCFEDGAGTVPATFPSEDIHAAYKGSACMLPNGKTDTYK